MEVGLKPTWDTRRRFQSVESAKRPLGVMVTLPASVVFAESRLARGTHEYRCAPEFASHLHSRYTCFVHTMILQH